MWRFAWLLLLLAVGGFPAEDRAVKLQRMLMAPCCWSENVAEHNSPIAKEMRAEIERLTSSGVSDEEILARFKNEYGARILTEPDGRAGVWLRAVPIAMMGFGTIWVCILLRRWVKQPRPAQHPAA